MDKVVHFEIPADNMDRAKKFYSEIFGWKIEKFPMPDGYDYYGARTVEVDDKFMPKEKGAINGGIMQRNDKVKAPVFAINVSSVNDYIKKVTANGGKLVMPKTEIAGMGYYAYVTDSEGNIVGLWESIKK